MKIDVPLAIPEDVDFPEYKDKEQLKRWIWRQIQIPQMMYLITTADENGIPNCEGNTWGLPFGFIPDQMFAFVCGRPHHTAQNVLQNGEFVVSIPSAEIGALAERTATPYPRGTNEVTASGLTPIPSKTVRPPRIKECKAIWNAGLNCTRRSARGTGASSSTVGSLRLRETGMSSRGTSRRRRPR